MKGRRAPDEGYSFGNKKRYRRDVWGGFKDLRNRYQLTVAGAQCLLMPSKEMVEVSEATKRGFCVRNMHLVDMNPAIVASYFSRQYPHATGYGVDVGRAAERIAKNGQRLDIANLDFCGPVGGSIDQQLTQFLDSGVLADNSFVAITILRGREKKSTTGVLRILEDEYSIGVAQLDKLKTLDRNNVLPSYDVDRATVTAHGMQTRDHARLLYLLHLFRRSGYAVSIFRNGIYKSNKSTMMWTIFGVNRIDRLVVLHQQVQAEAENLCREMVKRHGMRRTIDRGTHNPVLRALVSRSSFLETQMMAALSGPLVDRHPSADRYMEEYLIDELGKVSDAADIANGGN